jgi:hypothetical protein
MKRIAHTQTAHFQFAQADTQPKIVKELFLFLHTLKMTIFIA